MARTCGYVTQLDYSYGYYRELNPAMLRLVCLCSAIEPQLRDRPSYLELGFGQGLSINLHAAATEGRFWGTDFNPGQAVRARELAAASGADLHLLDDSFEEFAARTDLPDFDIIALHGIWSWISDANRKTILDIVRRKLRAGGHYLRQLQLPARMGACHPGPAAHDALWRLWRRPDDRPSGCD